MYFPYFHGKQFELIAIREQAELIARVGFVPIIEPVRESEKALKRTLDVLVQHSTHSIVILNPDHGDHSQQLGSIAKVLREGYAQHLRPIAGIMLTESTTVQGALELVAAHQDFNIALVHSGFTEPQPLADSLQEFRNISLNIFVENQPKLLYRKHFRQGQRVVIQDGFVRRRNADYPEVELFSELHVTFREQGVDGFGDFLIVGDGYSEGGGPAYAVAVHLTFIDPTKQDQMLVYHFVSDSRDSPTDPAGKFGQALDKLVAKLESGESHLHETSAILEFRELHRDGHFPGLGYVKKLSMIHHIETLVDYFERNA